MENENSNAGETTGRTDSNKKWAIGIVALALIAVFVFTGGFGIATGNVTGPELREEFTTPVSEITTQANWYEYNSGGVNVRFFAVKASDGSIKTGFDACDVCYTQHKGYRQEGAYMVCNNCGNRYPINGLGTSNKNPGGCWPGYLPNKVIGNKLVIRSSDLENGRSRFL